MLEYVIHIPVSERSGRVDSVLLSMLMARAMLLLSI